MFDSQINDKTKMPTKIFICAGDSSGSNHAARLMHQLRKLVPDIEFCGIGGREMECEGLQSIIPLHEISVVGFWEVAKKYSLFKKVLDKSKKMLSSGEIAAFIPVDYPGFNIRLATDARKIGLPVIYYIAPQLWAWGKSRAKKLAHCVDLLLTVFPFEEDYFKQFGLNAKFVGHPILDNQKLNSEELINAAAKREERRKVIAFFPGSRRQELAKHISLIEEIAIGIKKLHPDYSFTIARSPLIDIDAYHAMLSRNHLFEISDDRFELMRTSMAGIVKTGTSNLEAALCGLPFTMFYKISPLTYAIGKQLINLNYLSIVNILFNKCIVREFIQRDATPGNIIDEICRLIEDKEYWSAMNTEILSIRHLLGDSGGAKNAAIEIVNYLRLNEPQI